MVRRRRRGGRPDPRQVLARIARRRLVEPTLSKTFYGQTRPVTDASIPEALAISGITREQHEAFDDPADVFARFRDWLAATSAGRPIFVSDNLAFDWQ